MSKLSPQEGIKVNSEGLRGSIKESLLDQHSGSVRPQDEFLVKFHGMYVQDDRDRRAERAEKKLDKLYSFMIRLRIPGGSITSDQWRAVHKISEDYGTGTIKITTRQTVQLHGVFKHQLKPTLSAFDLAKLDSIAACGDVNRNVVCSSHPQLSPVYQEIHAYADLISKHLLPKTQAYYEIWVEGEKIYEKAAEIDPLYEDRYLPRKFKIAIAIPPSNDVDVFTNDIGLIAIVENNEFKGFNVAVGGGLATTHGNPNTYARLGTVIGFVEGQENILKTVFEVLTVQRDFGNREDRKFSRLKYTVDKMTVDGFKAELEQRIGFKLQSERPYSFTERSDRFGWEEDHNGNWYYTFFTENGSITPSQKALFFTLANEIESINFTFTCNQNLIIGPVNLKEKSQISKYIKGYEQEYQSSLLRKNSMSCVALPTCPLALAEAQRYLPKLISKMEALLAKYYLDNEDIVTRMTGCPNGCGRPYVAEIGFVGTGPGQYNLMLGGDRYGERLNTLYKEKLNESQILTELDSLLHQYVEEKATQESFGDFCNRRVINQN
jgi:sulfite reductase (NADPH) hemoprotein beta-component